MNDASVQLHALRWLNEAPLMSGLLLGNDVWIKRERSWWSPNLGADVSAMQLSALCADALLFTCRRLRFYSVAQPLRVA